MYIKEIRLNGFKSFADKSIITLGKNFTGVVGPNGSGKSNIVDAIKWVLGEQSVKSLRGAGSMTDVIFGGSKSRNASSSASVSLVFDNSDHTLKTEYEEVSIKRSVYKSGENEYYINNEKCRLKDIVDLLIDSLASKESFNIIPQNKIDEILSDKPEERRTIFEDAAGVLKYRKRKEETLRKLERTQENIERIDMIVKELEASLLPLEKESLKALQYKEIRESLDNIEGGLITHDISKYKNLLDNCEIEKIKVTDELSKILVLSSSNDAKVEKLKLNLSKYEEKINQLQSSVLSITENLTHLSSKKELLKERSKYDKDSNEVKNSLVVLKEKELNIKNDIKNYEMDIKKFNIKIKETNDKLLLLADDLNNNSKERNIFNSELDGMIKRKYEITSKIDILKSNIENNSKVPYSVKAILESNKLLGIDNTIGNVIQTDSEYSLMLEVALGASSNFIITQNEENANEAISYLKEKRIGRATFFPLNVIKPRSVDPDTMNQIKGCKGYIDIVPNLLKYDKKYYNIIMNQLGNILVCKDAESAIYLSKLIKHRYRIVTLTGELLHVGGSLTGGSVNLFSSMSDKNELENQKNKLDTTNNEVILLEKKLKETDFNIDIIKNNTYKLTIELTNANEQKELRNKLYNDNIKILDEIKEELLSLKGEKIENHLKEIIDEYYKLELEKELKEKELKSLLDEKRNINDSITEIEFLTKRERDNNNLLTTRLNELEVLIVKYNMLLDNLLLKLNEEYNVTYEKALTIFSLEIEENDARNKVNNLRKRIKEIGDVSLSSIDEYERINKRYTFLNNQKTDLEDSKNNLLEIINQMDEIMAINFKATFESINKEFNKVFIKLFNGGEAKLVLTDPNDILNTGIDIIAIPSGKTLKPISLLSGGEKTLTAISLLFAIMNLKNVPFAVLDEVESALDEVNAERFGEYLNNYKNKTQILIITHKKKTMEFVDNLYGITMQESGVSKLVSVTLEEIK